MDMKYSQYAAPTAEPCALLFFCELLPFFWELLPFCCELAFFCGCELVFFLAADASPVGAAIVSAAERRMERETREGENFIFETMKGRCGWGLGERRCDSDAKGGEEENAKGEREERRSLNWRNSDSACPYL